MNKLEKAIVKALEEGPASALTIRDRIPPRVGWWAKLRFAWSFYPTLWSLVDRSVLLLEKRPGGPERGYRDKYIYTLILP